VVIVTLTVLIALVEVFHGTYVADQALVVEDLAVLKVV
jgi:hypothetical protein